MYDSIRATHMHEMSQNEGDSGLLGRWQALRPQNNAQTSGDKLVGGILGFPKAEKQSSPEEKQLLRSRLARERSANACDAQGESRRCLAGHGRGGPKAHMSGQTGF